MKSKKKLKVCLVFGGKSGEHEVSLQSAKSVYESLDKKKYDVLLVGIDKSGHWRLGAPSGYLLNATSPALIRLNKETPAVAAITKTGETKLIRLESGKELSNVDVFFPVTHGTFGEDGSLQGLLELLDVAYVGAGVLGSALGMDKDAMKRLLKAAGLPTAKFAAATENDLSPKQIKKIIRQLKFPIFVKPANLGSSVGVSKNRNLNELKKGIADAFQYDTKILLEEFIPGREIECAVLGNEDPIASIPGEIIPKHEFYSYEAKYIDENGAIPKIPARLSKKQIAEVQKTAVQVFKILECSGMARVDFFLKPNGKFIVNEINTIPGFTKISMYPKLWEASGIPYPKLLDSLIELALKKKRKKDKLKRSYGG